MTTVPRRRRATALSFTAALIAAAAAGGCGDLLKQPDPNKALFAIDPGTADVATGSTPPSSRPSTVLTVHPLRVSPPYDGAPLVYRTGPARYELDYYNNFVAPPAALMSGELVNWLDRSGPLPAVAAGDAARSDLSLTGSVTRVLVDFTDKAAAKGVVAVRFFLTRDQAAGTAELLLDQTYEASVPVAGNTPAAYAAALGAAYREILIRLSADLRSVPALGRP